MGPGVVRRDGDVQPGRRPVTVRSAARLRDQLRRRARFRRRLRRGLPGPRARSVSQNLARRRLRALLNELVDEGLLLRRRQRNQKDNRNDPTWHYVYRLADPVPQRIGGGEDTPAAGRTAPLSYRCLVPLPGRRTVRSGPRWSCRIRTRIAHGIVTAKRGCS